MTVRFTMFRARGSGPRLFNQLNASFAPTVGLPALLWTVLRHEFPVCGAPARTVLIAGRRWGWRGKNCRRRLGGIGLENSVRDFEGMTHPLPSFDQHQC
jgi:hypothetical protein